MSPVGTEYPAPQKLPGEGAALAVENYFFGRLPQENAETFYTNKFIVIDNQYIVLTYFVDFKEKISHVLENSASLKGSKVFSPGFRNKMCDPEGVEDSEIYNC